MFGTRNDYRQPCFWHADESRFSISESIQKYSFRLFACLWFVVFMTSFLRNLFLISSLLAFRFAKKKNVNRNSSCGSGSGSRKFRGELNWKFKIELILIFLNSRLKMISFNWTYSPRKIIETELSSLGRLFVCMFVRPSVRPSVRPFE